MKKGRQDRIAETLTLVSDYLGANFRLTAVLFCFKPANSLFQAYETNSFPP